MKSSFLLISDDPRSSWPQFLSEALFSLGSLKVISEKEAETELQQTDYNLVITDAAAVENVDQVVFRMRMIKPWQKIIVVTLSPTWQEAREVFRAGAVDYLKGSLTKKELESALVEVLRIPLVTLSD